MDPAPTAALDRAMAVKALRELGVREPYSELFTDVLQQVVAKLGAVPPPTRLLPDEADPHQEVLGWRVPGKFLELCGETTSDGVPTYSWFYEEDVFWITRVGALTYPKDSPEEVMGLPDFYEAMRRINNEALRLRGLRDLLMAEFRRLKNPRELLEFFREGGLALLPEGDVKDSR